MNQGATLNQGHALNQGYVYRDRVRPEDAGANVLDYHARRFPHAGLDEWRDTIDAGRVLVNDEVASAARVLEIGDRLEFRRPPWEEPAAPDHFAVLYEDDAVLAVDKPAGLQVLPAGPFLERTLLRLVQTSASSRAEAAPVHRLGRGTSGIVLFGRTAAARASLSMQFRDCTPTKTYLAWVEGNDLPDSVVARHPIGPVPHGPLQLHVAHPDGKPSTTRVRVLRRDRSAMRCLVAAQPITGRPDQIRIHLAALGAPIVGDPLFGVGGVAKSDVPPGACGYLLHATRLRCRHPFTGRELRLRSTPPW